MILVIDTSGPVCAAGIFDSGANALVASKSEMLGKGHAERLIPMIDEVLSEAGLALKDMTRIGVTIGPGSFTGLRVGLSTLKGLAYALQVPLVGVSSLEALAVEAGGPDVAALAVVKKGEVYLGRYRRGTLEPITTHPVAEAGRSRTATP